MNGKVCCILGVCCPPGSQAQEDAFTEWLIVEGGLEAVAARRIARLVLSKVDMAPKGTLGPLVSEVAKMARKER